MDTAKVDIRKLQLLNDRINQCIDALNQVRLSVHGLSHTAASPQVAGMPGLNPWTQSPSIHSGFTVLPQASPLGMTAPFVPGLSHTSPSPLFVPAAGAVPGIPIAGLNPYGSLSHTGSEFLETPGRPVWADPLLSSRIAQTFPYAYVPLPPVVTIY